ncbi:alpha/beta hydrolase [Sphingobacterium spiritivorum]|uniref:alpha/beta hydrolase n=1 Tax=Sphingobacterium spiritivorum TaxID=258 RepID=UPI001917E0D4|nr:alpha/beta hydrolase [Sphingobacterium spiritivorum]QQT26687.1 alpha/beta hydrolase [Sphingobacterium spiritivorum]
MKYLLLLALSVYLSPVVAAQEIYSKAYGVQSNPAIIFIHGGPSGNSNLFEGTTAQSLADEGFYVIVYDRRGEGRSKDEQATMTYKESFADLLQLYKTYSIDKANIIGHSFGGIIATLFTDQYPEKVSSLVLAGALCMQQQTYDHILTEAKQVFRQDDGKLQEIQDIQKLDKHSADYRKKTYNIASQLYHFTMPRPTPESIRLREQYEESEFNKSNFRNHESPFRFYKNEKNNNVDNRPALKRIKEKKIPIYAIYGKEDGIFSPKQITDIRRITGAENMQIVDNCSHYLFVDQQTAFIAFLKGKL